MDSVLEVLRKEIIKAAIIFFVPALYLALSLQRITHGRIEASIFLLQNSNPLTFFISSLISNAGYISLLAGITILARYSYWRSKTKISVSPFIWLIGYAFLVIGFFSAWNFISLCFIFIWVLFITYSLLRKRDSKIITRIKLGHTAFYEQIGDHYSFLIPACLVILLSQNFWLVPENITFKNGLKETYITVNQNSGYQYLLKVRNMEPLIISNDQIVERTYCRMTSTRRPLFSKKLDKWESKCVSKVE